MRRRRGRHGGSSDGGDRGGEPVWCSLDRGAAADLIREVLQVEGIGDGELGLQLVGPDEIRDLKREHLGIDEETDALAFPIDGRDATAGGDAASTG